MPENRDQEVKILHAFCILVFRGDLTERGKINLLEDLQWRYPNSGYGELAHVLRMLSSMDQVERHRLFEESVNTLLARQEAADG